MPKRAIKIIPCIPWNAGNTQFLHVCHTSGKEDWSPCQNQGWGGRGTVREGLKVNYASWGIPMAISKSRSVYCNNRNVLLGVSCKWITHPTVRTKGKRLQQRVCSGIVAFLHFTNKHPQGPQQPQLYIAHHFPSHWVSAPSSSAPNHGPFKASEEDPGCTRSEMCLV